MGDKTERAEMEAGTGEGAQRWGGPDQAVGGVRDWIQEGEGAENRARLAVNVCGGKGSRRD